MFDSIDQKSLNYLVGGTVTVFAGLFGDTVIIYHDLPVLWSW